MMEAWAAVGSYDHVHVHVCVCCAAADGQTDIWHPVPRLETQAGPGERLSFSLEGERTSLWARPRWCTCPHETSAGARTRGPWVCVALPGDTGGGRVGCRFRLQ